MKPVALVSLTAAAVLLTACENKQEENVSVKAESPVVAQGFVDMNGNGVLDAYEDKSLPRAARVADLMGRLSTEQKVALVSGTGFSMDKKEAQKDKLPGAAGFTVALEEFGIPQTTWVDGPAGIRIWPERDGTDQTYYGTAFPIETLLSSSWDTDLVQSFGKAVGLEGLEYGVDIWLAPGMNIHRDPRGGRNFEYFSEDPVLNGKMAAATVKGTQSTGVGATPKHYVANNQETNRYVVDTIVSERALREIYLRGFEIVVKESDPWAIMSAYNQVNSTPATQEPELMTTVLRDEWGFNGVIVTDWFAGMEDTVAQMNAGNELLMPGMPEGTAMINDGLASGALSMAQLDKNVAQILDVLFRTPAFNHYQYSDKPDLKSSAKLARHAAAEGAVLLKNDDATLPLAGDVKKIAAFGNTSYSFISGGTGSGDVNEAYTVSLVDGLENAGLSVDAELQQQYTAYLEAEYAKRPEKEHFWLYEAPPAERHFDDAVFKAKAKDSDVALITIGRNSGEFQDRPLEGDFYLSDDERELISRVTAAFKAEGKKAIVVLNIGNVIETASWRDIPDAIIVPWQGGQEAGNALVDLLLGKVAPSGKLPMSFPMDHLTMPTSKTFPGYKLSDETQTVMGIFEAQPWQVNYEEDIFVGYRYYDTFNVDVSYPFGYGLSYTSFAYGDLTLSSDTFTGSVTASVKVTNTGKVAGKEVAQLYLSAPAGAVVKPKHELKGFAKTSLLAPSASEVLSFELDARALSSFVDAERAWVADAGEYKVEVGASSRDIKATASFTLAERQVVQPVIANLAPEKPLNRPMMVE